MTTPKNHQPDELNAESGAEFNTALDIVFEHRNKAYGAYFLRKSYPKVLRTATFAGILFFGLATSAPLLQQYLIAQNDKETFINPELVNAPPPPPSAKTPPPPPPPPPPPEPPRQATIAFVAPKPVIDEEVKIDDPPPRMEDMQDVEIATTTQEGTKSTNEAIEEVIYQEVLSKEDEVKVEPVQKQETPEEPSDKDEDGIFKFVEQMPEFDGGHQAMLQYLGNNIQYPEIARRAGIEGPVSVQFIVDENGDISQATITRGIGGGCDEEALRVVNAMPRWRAGKQNGKPVKVRHNIQVRFKLR